MGNAINNCISQTRVVKRFRFWVNERRDRKEQLDADALLQNDPDANYKPVTERRYIVWARQPETGNRLRAQVLRKNMEIDGEPSYLVRWGSYAHKEHGSDAAVPVRECTEDDFEATPSSRFSHYLSFVQTVGKPIFDYRCGETCYIRAAVGDQWFKAVVLQADQHYYFVKYSKDASMSGEWIHKASMRLRKEISHGGEAPDVPLWDTLYELDWVRVRHPTVNQYKSAKIVQRVPGRKRGEGSLIVQYEDPTLLLRQETIFEKAMRMGNDQAKIEFYRDWKKRWRYNRLFVYTRAMKAVGYSVRPMSGENGHSLFRALSEQLLGTDANFLALRRRCFMHIVKHKKYFSHFLDINFEQYAALKKRGIDGEYFAMGDHLDIQAVCELYDVRCDVYSELSPKPLDAIHFYPQMKDLPVVRLSYRGQSHYDSVEHEDSPLPISLEINLRKVAVGQILHNRGIVIGARIQEYERTMKITRALTTQQRVDRVVVVVEALVAFTDDTLTPRFVGLLKAVGITRNIPSKMTANDVRPDVERTWDSQRHQVRVNYPATPEVLEGNPERSPLLRMQGEELSVQKGIRYIHAYFPEVSFTLTHKLTLQYVAAERWKKKKTDGKTKKGSGIV